MHNLEPGSADYVDPKKEIDELKAQLRASQGKVRLLMEEHAGLEAQVSALENVIDKLIDKLGDL
jgi:prefoldin subunit 5